MSSRRLRILHLITTLETGGAQTMLWNLVSHMNAAAFENRVVSMTALGAVGERLRDHGVTVDVLGMRRGLPDVRGLLPLRRIVREFRPDGLQTWLYHADLLGTMLSRTMGIRPLIWNIRCATMDLSRYGLSSRLTLRFLARLSRRPEAVIVNSRAGLVLHESLGFNPRRWALIPNGFDVKRFSPDDSARARLRSELGLREESLLIGLIARYDAMKGHDAFLAAAADVARQAGVHFVLAGGGVDMQNQVLKELIAKSGIQSRVFLLGERRDVPALLAGLDVVCSASIGEGFPNAVGEAMACGIPCVVTDTGDSAWLLGEHAGKVVPVSDSGALSKALSEMIAVGRDARAAMGAAGRRRIVENFTLDSAVSHYEDLYYGLIGSGRAVSHR